MLIDYVRNLCSHVQYLVSCLYVSFDEIREQIDLSLCIDTIMKRVI